MWKSCSRQRGTLRVKVPSHLSGGFPLGLLGGSWGLSKWVNNGDNWGYHMAYRGY